MPDFRVADTAPEHPKLRAAGLPAAGLWALAGAYSMRELTDGWVPGYWVATWPQGARHAAALIRVGLWHPQARHGLPGYAFHDWDGYQRAAEKIRQDRISARERAEKSRRSSAARAPAPKPHVRKPSHDSLALALTKETSPPLSRTQRTRIDKLAAAADATAEEIQTLLIHTRRQRPDVRSPLAFLTTCHANGDLADQLAELRAGTRRKRTAAARRAAIDACDRCDDNGQREITPDRYGRCDHTPKPAEATG